MADGRTARHGRVYSDLCLTSSSTESSAATADSDSSESFDRLLLLALLSAGDWSKHGNDPDSALDAAVNISSIIIIIIITYMCAHWSSMGSVVVATL